MGELDQVKKMADRPLNELLTRDMVDIYVGPDSTHWILHEKLLCSRSAFFRRTFYTSRRSSSASSSSPRVARSSNTSSPATKSIGLPDEDDAAFTSFVAWLYSNAVPPPVEEADLTTLLDLYLMAEKWGIPNLQDGTLRAVRRFYARMESYPGLRRVQYVYANTAEGSPMRELLVGSVARMLVLGQGRKDGVEGMPAHWEKALRKNGMLATDVILKVYQWGLLREEDVPDVRQEETQDEQKEGRERRDEQEGGDEKSEEDGDRNVKKEESESFNMKTLDKELPNGLVNGVH